MIIQNISDIPMKTKKRKRQSEGSFINDKSILNNEKPFKKKKSFKVDSDNQIGTEELRDIKPDISSFTTEETVATVVSQENGETNNRVRSKRKKRRKAGKVATDLNEIEGNSGEIHSSEIKQEKIDEEDNVSVKIVDVTNKIKRKRKNKIVSLQDNLTGNVDEKADLTHLNETHSSKIKQEEIVEEEIVDVATKIKHKRKKKNKSDSEEVNLTGNVDEKTVADVSKEVPSLPIESGENNDGANCDIMLNVISEPVKTNANTDFFQDVHTKIQKLNKRKGKFNPEPEQHIGVLGDLKSQIDDHERHEEGVKMSFKKANLSSTTLHYHRKGSFAKQGYKHLIKGDVLLHFKNSNLHEIVGYGNKDEAKE